MACQSTLFSTGINRGSNSGGFHQFFQLKKPVFEMKFLTIAFLFVAFVAGGKFFLDYFIVWLTSLIFNSLGWVPTKPERFAVRHDWRLWSLGWTTVDGRSPTRHWWRDWKAVPRISSKGRLQKLGNNVRRWSECLTEMPDNWLNFRLFSIRYHLFTPENCDTSCKSRNEIKSILNTATKECPIDSEPKSTLAY